MLPLRDLNPTQTKPVMTVILILANVAAFLYEVSLGPSAGRELVYAYGMIPARVPLALGGHAITLGQAFLPFLTSVFLHGSVVHLLGNMWYLWVFGDNVEDSLGHFGFLVFYLGCGLGAGLTHTVAAWGSAVPAVGASGANSAFVVSLRSAGSAYER